ncbi:hypothetical protein C0J52_17943 [Blattella germanica]|nr:hypothetical protein C0J52_17943 [Blattella germanica]
MKRYLSIGIGTKSRIGDSITTWSRSSSNKNNNRRFNDRGNIWGLVETSLATDVPITPCSSAPLRKKRLTEAY